MTEQEMRASKAPTPATLQELVNYIEGLQGQDHGYGTCVYAMSLAACAAYNYMADKLGVTGFQASCADMDIIRRNRHMEGPFMLVDVSKALYPQYHLTNDLREYIEKSSPWLKEQAAKLLADRSDRAHPEVIAHWRKLAEVE